MNRTVLAAHSTFFTPALKKMFVWDWSTVTGTLVDEKNLYLSVSRLPCKGFSRNCTPRPFRTYVAKDLSLSWLVSNYRHFAWGTECVFCCHSESNKGVFFLKIHTSQNPRLCYKISKFCCDRSLIKGSLLGLHCIVRVRLSWLPVERFSWKCIPLTHRTCDRSGASVFATGQQVKALCLGSIVSAAVTLLPLEVFSLIFSPDISVGRRSKKVVIFRGTWILALQTGRTGSLRY
jgi:hypothetical protein